MPRKVLLVGATGMLGGAIADAVFAHDKLALRALVRPGNPESARALRDRGAEVAEGDALEPATLPPAVEDADVVVCALHNDPQVFVTGHRNLILAAKQAGVGRFVPSDFSVDLFKLRPDENFNLAMRHEVAPLFEGLRMRPIHILNGAFLDTMLDPQVPFIDWDNGVVPYFGDPEQPCDFTSVRDTARYVAEAGADIAAPETLRFAGEVATMPAFAAAVSRGLGKPLEAKRQGSVEDLAALISEKRATARSPWDYVFLQYHHNMMSGRGKLHPLDNGRYPSVRPEGIEEFARRQ